MPMPGVPLRYSGCCAIKPRSPAELYRWASFSGQVLIMKKFAIAAVLLAASTASEAEWGIGDKLCSDYLRVDRSSYDDFEPFTQWMLGYMTGLNDYVQSDPSEKYPYFPILKRLEYYCTDSGMRFANAVRRAVQDVYRPTQRPRREFER
ncbi:MAG: hypothetical protein WCE61_03975 [Candidatus Acidiferrum sp.]